MDRVAIFAALRWECVPVVRSLRQVRRLRVGDFQVWLAPLPQGEVWVVKTGIGIDQAAAAAQALTQSGQFSLFLSTGCAGALAPDLQPGDLVIADAIVGEAPSGAVQTDAEHSRRLRGIAAAAALRSCAGSILCSRTMLATSSTKRAAATQHGSLAVEMEGGALASAAAASQIPFAAVRAVLDTAETELRHAGKFMNPQTGGVKPVALAAYLAKHPGAIGDLLELQKMMRAAQGSLQQFFTAWFSSMYDGSLPASDADLKQSSRQN
ncbi:MAG TPA: hypothetical protein VMT89_06190 [Candidatus Acidoferrales bacterium]|nr:hypothetical protein [Candidatus Acidoferrales bacterium]